MTQQRRFHTRKGGPNVLVTSGPSPRQYLSDTDCGDRVPITDVVGHVPSNNADNTCTRCWKKIRPRQPALPTAPADSSHAYHHQRS